MTKKYVRPWQMLERERGEGERDYLIAFHTLLHSTFTRDQYNSRLLGKTLQNCLQ